MRLVSSRHKAARRNINAATVVLTQCRELTSLMATAKQQIEDGRYYPALRTLDSIAHQLSVAYEQPFVARVQCWLPELANQIKAAALRDVAHWLVVIRSKTTAIGKGALRKCVNYVTGQGARPLDLSFLSLVSLAPPALIDCRPHKSFLWKKTGASGGGFAASYGGSGPASAGAAKEPAGAVPTPAKLVLQQVHNVVSYTTWMDEAELLAALPAFLRMGAEGEQAFNAALNALPENLDPVHRALHIHAHLGALDEVAQFYINNRLPQVRLRLLLLLLLRPQHRHRIASHRICVTDIRYYAIHILCPVPQRPRRASPQQPPVPPRLRPRPRPRPPPGRSGWRTSRTRWRTTAASLSRSTCCCGPPSTRRGCCP